MIGHEKQPQLWNRLRRYRALCAEVERLGQGEAVEVTDTVRGSSKYFPYQERVFTISGVVLRRSGRLKAAKRDLAAAKKEVEEIIAGIDDPWVRDIVELRFIGGLSWAEVAAQIGGGNTASGTRSAVRRYFCGG